MGSEATADAAHNYIVEGDYSGLMSVRKGVVNVDMHRTSEGGTHDNFIGRGNVTWVELFWTAEPTSLLPWHRAIDPYADGPWPDSVIIPVCILYTAMIRVLASLVTMVDFASL